MEGRVIWLAWIIPCRSLCNIGHWLLYSIQYTGEVWKCTSCWCQIFSGFNTQKSLKSVNFRQSYYVSSSYRSNRLGLSSGVARILLQGARARGARVPKFFVTKVIQKWRASGIRYATTNMAEVFATACHSNWWLWRSNFELTELGRKISTPIVWTAAKFACIRKLHFGTCPMPDDATGFVTLGPLRCAYRRLPRVVLF